MATTARSRLALPRSASARRQKRTASILVNGSLFLICLLWTIPTIGLLISSFRPRDTILTSGWWTVFPHRAYVSVDQVDLGRGTPVDQPLVVAGTSVTDQQLRDGVMLDDGRRAIWENRRQRLIGIQESNGPPTRTSRWIITNKSLRAGEWHPRSSPRLLSQFRRR